MSEKANSLIDELNKILTNTLDYKEFLVELSKSVSHEETKKKLEEFAEVKQDESQNLMKVIKSSGGQIETNERMTDQNSLYWVSRTPPDPNDTKAVLTQLISAEKNIIEDYDAVLSDDQIDKEFLEIPRKHHEQAEANLKYLQTASESIK